MVRVLVAKVLEVDRLSAVLKQVPVRSGEEGWNCVLWVKEALNLVSADDRCLGRKVTEWKAVRDAAMDYVERKKAEGRFDVKVVRGNPAMTKAATYDLIEGKEAVP